MRTPIALDREPAPAVMPTNDTTSLPEALTAGQLTAIRTVMALFVDDDLTRGISPRAELYCRACQQGRPMPGFILYERYQFCNRCATEYEVARLCSMVASPGQFVREKTFGEADRYALPGDDG